MAMLLFFCAWLAQAASVRQLGKSGIVIEGPIVEGDHARLLALVRKSRGTIDSVTIYSHGGSVFEAIKIGTLIRDLQLRTTAPTRNAKRGNVCPGIAQQRHCTCLSACIFVFAGGVHRTGNVLGVHRSYVGQGYPAYSRADHGGDTSDQLAYTTSDYLKRMGFPPAFIERMNATRSQDIAFLKDDEIRRHLSGYAPSFRKKLADRCGKRGAACLPAEERKLRREAYARVMREAGTGLKPSRRTQAFYSGSR